MHYLLIDPRPQNHDTGLWDRLLKQKKSIPLQSLLWSMRSAGMMLTPDGRGRLKFSIRVEDSDFDSEIEFEAMKKRHLAPYTVEIKELLDGLMTRR